jgi:hypothetical protein
VGIDRMKILSSKKYSAGNMDYWWYNLSNIESWMKPNSQISFILNEKNNMGRIGTILLRLDRNNWYDRIRGATCQTYIGRKVIKVHVTKKNREPYRIYFGRLADGAYHVTLEPE